MALNAFQMQFICILLSLISLEDFIAFLGYMGHRVMLWWICRAYAVHFSLIEPYPSHNFDLENPPVKHTIPVRIFCISKKNTPEALWLGSHPLDVANMSVTV